MSLQSSIIANPLNDSSSDDNKNEYVRNGQSEQDEQEQVEQEEYPINPLESDEEGNESAVLQHLINNDKEDHSSKSNELSNPMIEDDPISLENIHNQNFASIGQQYHVCQTVLDCNKTIELQQDQNPIYSCDELLDPKQSNKEKSKEQIKNLESQLELILKENQMLKKQLLEKEMYYIEQVKIKDQELTTLNEQNKNLIDNNSELKGKVSNQQNEIYSLQQQINQLQSEQIIQQRSKTGAETTRYDPQDLHKATSLNDQAIANLSANQLEVRKIPTLSIDIPSAFSTKPKLPIKDQFLFKNGTSKNYHLTTEESKKQRLHKMPNNQRSLQDLIHKAQIGIAFSKTNTSSLQKVQGSGQLFFESNSTKRNQQQIQLASKQ
ncbi:unnamed protein product [Paramecium sonneborni]|uniref:Uncharacterized protein n=1 Tax=Paramecium sonneborni TaxID=65129 RepID=A0A8S1QT78_9CILI|nr:unnamed protein product [Paramecium sonneborni]